jgi:hypothetical protein
VTNLVRLVIAKNGFWKNETTFTTSFTGHCDAVIDKWSLGSPKALTRLTIRIMAIPKIFYCP